MERINRIVRDCFITIIQLQWAESSPLLEPESVWHRLRSCVEDLLRQAEDAGFSQQDAQDMAYAVVALMDEVMLARPEPYRRFWMNDPLQRHFFQENAAGERFFHRLQQLRAEPHRREVLRVYYLCLVFGFRGLHHTPVGQMELMRLMHAVRRATWG
jgi:type VI secretion system protein ImpK